MNMRRIAPMGVAFSLAALAACGGRHHLASYDFTGRSLAVVHFGAPAPRLVTGDYDLQASDPVGAVVAAGGRVVREVEVRRARARLDSAAHRIDLADRVAERTLDRASRYLGARPVTDRESADYLLEVDIRSMGLNARSDRVHLYVTGEAILLDGRTGREIWSEDVAGSDPLTPDFGEGDIMRDVLGAGALSMLSVEDFETVLGRLADYAADRMARELRSDLRDTRSGR